MSHRADHLLRFQESALSQCLKITPEWCCQIRQEFGFALD